MADIALDADGLGRDRQRYFGLLEQAEQQIAAWNERADHLQQAIDGLDRLLALSGQDPAQDGGVPRGAVIGRGVAASGHQQPAVTAPVTPAPTRKTASEKATKKAAGRTGAVKKPPSPTATPAAPEPVEPPAEEGNEAPRGTDALRLVFESDAERAWSLGDLIDTLGARGWLPTSRRPEEGVRISLKRLAERGRVVRTDDGQWRLADPASTGPTEERWPPAEVPPAPSAPAAEAAPAAEQPAPSPPGRAPPRSTGSPLPTPFGRPVGGTVTEV